MSQLCLLLFVSLWDRESVTQKRTTPQLSRSFLYTFQLYLVKHFDHEV